MCGGVVQFHGRSISEGSHVVNGISRNIEIREPAMTEMSTSVIPGRAKHEPGIYNHDPEYGACAKRRIHDVQLHIGE
jgi:hypothetical protein